MKLDLGTRAPLLPAVAFRSVEGVEVNHSIGGNIRAILRFAICFFTPHPQWSDRQAIFREPLAIVVLDLVDPEPLDLGDPVDLSAYSTWLCWSIRVSNPGLTRGRLWGSRHRFVLAFRPTLHRRLAL